jgi:hypothetical protein
VRRWIWLTVLLILAIVPAGSEARSHRFLSLDIEAQVGADAVVRITETHTVQFDGTFSGMFQTFNISRVTSPSLTSSKRSLKASAS